MSIEQQSADSTILQLEEVPKYTQQLGLALLLVIVGSITWALLSQLDVVSIASGSIIPSSKVQKVQHLEGGIIETINVREGDKVIQGQALISLSSTVSEAEMEEINLRIHSLQADMLRLETESKGNNELNFTTDFKQQHPDLVKLSINLFRARRASLKNNLAVQQSEIRLYANEVNEIKVRLVNNSERLTLVKEQVEIGENLLRNNLSNRYEQIERLKEVNTLRSKINNDKAALNRSKTGVIKAKAQLEQVQTEFNESVQRALSETRQNLDEFQTRSTRFKDSIDRTILRAPVTGTVKRLYVSTEGGVTRPGETLLEIVPGNDLLIVEAQLPPQEIGHVEIGQAAFVQLEASDAANLGKIEGIVKHISPDSLITSEGLAYYIVHITVNKNYFGDDDDRVMLFPGMIVSTGIVLGKRSVMGYLLSPFTENAAFIFTEQ